MNNVHVINNIFVANALAHLRNKHTPTVQFRHYSDIICQLVFTAAVQGLKTQIVEIETPLEKTTVTHIKEDVIIISILRSGIAMLFGAMQLLPDAKVGFIGLERDEQTAIAKEYYWKLPAMTKDSLVIVTDPMLATGGSIRHVLKRLQPQATKEIRIASIIAVPEGIQTIHQEFPQIPIYTAGVDRALNSQKYILPGLGDYGDRYFGTIR